MCSGLEAFQSVTLNWVLVKGFDLSYLNKETI